MLKNARTHKLGMPPEQSQRGNALTGPSSPDGVSEGNRSPVHVDPRRIKTQNLSPGESRQEKQVRRFVLCVRQTGGVLSPPITISILNFKPWYVQVVTDESNCRRAAFSMYRPSSTEHKKNCYRTLTAHPQPSTALQQLLSRTDLHVRQGDHAERLVYLVEIHISERDPGVFQGDRHGIGGCNGKLDRSLRKMDPPTRCIVRTNKSGGRAGWEQRGWFSLVARAI